MYVKLKLVQEVATLRGHRWADAPHLLNDDHAVAVAIARGGEVKKKAPVKEKSVVEIVREQMRKRELEQRTERLKCPWR
jgi:hypothetical protein